MNSTWGNFSVCSHGAPRLPSVNTAKGFSHGRTHLPRTFRNRAHTEALTGASHVSADSI